MDGVKCKTLAPAGRASKGAFDGAHIALLQLSSQQEMVPGSHWFRRYYKTTARFGRR